MTRRTGEIGVFSSQIERGLPSVVERPAFPIGRIVTLHTVGAEPAFVDILILMTAKASGRCVQVSLGRVAIPTVGSRMRAQQRKRRELMIEPHVFGPALIIVALAAAVPELTLVRIFLAMAARTG